MAIHARRFWRTIPGGLLLAPLLLTGCAGTAPGSVPREKSPGAHAATTRSVPQVTPTSRPAARAGRPNIVMVMADDMRVDDLQFAPNVRHLIGRHGLRFENSFAPFPLCCPDRASLFTGQYAHNHHVYWHTRPYGYGAFDDSRTIATSLHAAGYNTGFIGKYLNGYGPMRSKVSGLPSWRYVPRGWTDWMASFENPHVGGIHGDTYNYWDSPYNVNGRVDNRYRGRYQTRVIGDFSVRLAWKYHRRPQPFFLDVAFVAPHKGIPIERGDPRQMRRSDGVPYLLGTPARPHWVRGRFNRVITRASGMPKGGGPAEADMSDKPFRMRIPEVTPTERRALTNVTRQRAEAVFVLDRQVGRLVRALKRSGEWANTVFMFTSDNGYFLGEHRQRAGKVTAHEPSLRVPFLVTGPGMRTGQPRYDPISIVDVSATILDLAGARPPRRPDGISRLPTMRSGDRGWTVPVVTEAINTSSLRYPPGFPRTERRTSIGLRTARYSFTRYSNGQGELYDLKTDPNEFNSVYSKPAYAELRRRLTKQWYRYKDCAGAACRRPMPAWLQATPAQNRALTRHFWAEWNRVYGR